MTEKRFTTTGNILHDGLANSKTITVETEEDAEILCGVLNDLNEKGELLDKITDIIASYEMKREQMNSLKKENKQLKQSVNNLKDTIIKITIAYQRKYDRTIVDLVDEVHDEDITDLIKELKE